MSLGRQLGLQETKPLDVIALGAAIVDVIGFVSDQFLAEQNAPKAGMMLVDSSRADMIHSAMKVAADGPLREIGGGSAANTMAGLAALGAQTHFVGKTKDDALGALFRTDIQSIGVGHGTPILPSSHEGATARCVVMVTPDAQRTMCTDLGVSGRLEADDLPIDLLSAAKITYLEGYLWDRDATKDAFKSAATHTRAAGGKLALTLSDIFCVDRHRESFRTLVEGSVDILFANEAEIGSLFETTDLATALDQAAKATPLVFVTRSEKGCVAIGYGEREEVAAAPIEQLVDTTGAGDLFASGVLYGLIRGRSLHDCARMGCLAASEIVQHSGARPEADLTRLFAAHSLA
jgi:sugar/nucleoside kinase (ribokinase family)